MVVGSFGVGQVFWSLIWITLFAMWIMLLLRVVTDVFTSEDLSGWAKAAWVVLGVVFPFLGVLTYVIVRGEGMTSREVGRVRAQEEVVQQYIRSAAGTSPSVADELERLVGLRDQGVLSDDEFAALKARLIG